MAERDFRDRPSQITPYLLPFAFLVAGRTVVAIFAP